MGIAEILVTFPRLHQRKNFISSPATGSYNCIAWAAGSDDRWWWPDQQQVNYWPDKAPRELTEEAFIAAFGVLGYQECDSRLVERGIEKVALYSKERVPQHAARQLTNGLWTSKLGKLEDITHRLEELEGAVYGKVSRVLARQSK